MKFFLASIFLSTNLILQAGIPITSEYYGPTETLIARESWEEIKFSLIKKRVPLEMIPLFDSIAANENWGHIGYHGSTHEYRFYQDVIKFTLEEILTIKIKKDFHFLRIPGDTDLNLNSTDEFSKHWGKEHVNNRGKIRAKQLLSLNFGIYSNYKTSNSCSACLFIKDKSSSEVDYVENLVPFFNIIGIKDNEKELRKLHKIFTKWLKNEGGILLQISENSHLIDSSKEAYNFADKLCYPAIKGGYRYDNGLISAHFQKAMSTDYINQNTNISDQLRLLMNNRYTLNPFSHLTIKRWDLENVKTVDSYEKEMRQCIRNLKYDSSMVTKYHDHLMKEWKKK